MFNKSPSTTKDLRRILVYFHQIEQYRKKNLENRYFPASTAAPTYVCTVVMSLFSENIIVQNLLAMNWLRSPVDQLDTEYTLDFPSLQGCLNLKYCPV